MIVSAFAEAAGLQNWKVRFGGNVDHLILHRRFVHHFYPLPSQVQVMFGQLFPDFFYLKGDTLRFHDGGLFVQFSRIQSPLRLGHLNLLFIFGALQIS